MREGCEKAGSAESVVTPARTVARALTTMSAFVVLVVPSFGTSTPRIAFTLPNFFFNVNDIHLFHGVDVHFAIISEIFHSNKFVRALVDREKVSVAADAAINRYESNVEGAKNISLCIGQGVVRAAREFALHAEVLFADDFRVCQKLFNFRVGPLS